MMANQSEPFRASGGDGRKNVQSACDACKKRKKRCDGLKPTCGLCANLNSECVYSERKVRGPGKSKDYILQLEERLKKVESSINSRSSSSSPAGSGSTQDATPAFHHVNDLASVLSDVRTGSEGYVGPSLPEPPPPPGVQVPSAVQPPPLFASADQHQQQPLTAALMREFGNTNAAIQEMHARSTSHSFPRIVFVPLPPQFNVTRMLQSTWDTLVPHNLLFALDDVLNLVNQQFAVAGTDSCGESPARWAIVNALVASSVLHKVTNDYLNSSSHIAWDFFKNAFAMFSEIMAQGDDILSCQALLAMALFTRGTADARTTTQLVAAASRLVCSLGLHEPEFYHTTELTTMTRARRVFWTARWLDTETAHKYGPAMYLSELDLPIIELAYSSEDQLANCLEKMGELSTIQARVNKMLHSSKTLDASLDLVQTVLSLQQEVHSWRGTLPPDLQLPIDLTEPLNVRVAMVHLNYYSTRINIFMILARLRRPSPSRIAQIMRFRTSSADSTIESFWDRATSSARDLIELSLALPTDLFFSLWEMLCYPLSAFLLLFNATLDGQMSANAQANIAAGAAFVGFLERLRGAGCDVARVLTLCSKLQQVSSMTVDSDIRPDSMHCIKDFHSRLGGVDDWLQLAQGLLCNIPVLRARTEEVFGSMILLFMQEPMDGVYGACAPEILKSEHQSFRFGP